MSSSKTIWRRRRRRSAPTRLVGDAFVAVLTVRWLARFLWRTWRVA